LMILPVQLRQQTPNWRRIGGDTSRLMTAAWVALR